MRRDFTHRRGSSGGLRRGVTLIELLVVISIVGMLVALTLPALMAARESGRRAQCQNNLRQLVVAVDSFHTSHNRYPYSQFLGEYGAGPDSQAWSWLARVLPFLERRDLHDLGGIPKQKLNESAATSHRVEIFLCPTNYVGSGPRLDAGNLVGLPVGVTTYKGVSGANWARMRRSMSPARILRRRSPRTGRTSGPTARTTAWPTATAFFSAPITRSCAARRTSSTA